MDEVIVFDGNGVKITTARVVAGNETYALRNITSVRLERGGSWTWPIILIVIGAPMLLSAFGGGEVIGGLLVVGLMLTAAGLWQGRKALGTNIVIHCSGADRVAYRTGSAAAANRILQALNDAIAKR